MIFQYSYIFIYWDGDGMGLRELRWMFAVFQMSAVFNL